MADRRFVAIVALLTLALVGSLGQAREAWPERQITLVIPFAAGGPTDAVARIVGAQMTTVLGRPVVIENVPGAGGTIGAARVAHAAPDGYLLIVGNVGTHGAARSEYADLRYDPIDDFTPIGLTAGLPMLVVTRNSFPAADLQELVAQLKARGDKIIEGHAGHRHRRCARPRRRVGSQSHAFCSLLHSVAGTQATRVAYRGTGPLLNDLIAGRVDFTCATLPSVIAHLRGGLVRALAVASPQRVDIISRVPTAAESGFPAFQASAWNGLFAPKGLEPEIQAKLLGALRGALADPNVRQRLTEIGCDLPDSSDVSPETLRRLVETEVRRWGQILQPVDAASK